MVEMGVVMDGFLPQEAETMHSSFSREIFVDYAWLVQVHRKHMEVFKPIFHSSCKKC